MKVDKETRKKAILVLSVCASNKCGTFVACRDLDIQDRDVDRLVMDAFAYAAPAWNRWLGPHRKPTPIYAEAESLLRCGWTPEGWTE